MLSTMFFGFPSCSIDVRWFSSIFIPLQLWSCYFVATMSWAKAMVLFSTFLFYFPMKSLTCRTEENRKCPIWWLDLMATMLSSLSPKLNFRGPKCLWIAWRKGTATQHRQLTTGLLFCLILNWMFTRKYLFCRHILKVLTHLSAWGQH